MQVRAHRAQIAVGAAVWARGPECCGEASRGELNVHLILAYCQSFDVVSAPPKSQRCAVLACTCRFQCRHPAPSAEQHNTDCRCSVMASTRRKMATDCCSGVGCGLRVKLLPSRGFAVAQGAEQLEEEGAAAVAGLAAMGARRGCAGDVGRGVPSGHAGLHGGPPRGARAFCFAVESGRTLLTSRDGVWHKVSCCQATCAASS